MRHVSGVSLVELLIAVALSAVILGFSIPSFSALQRNNHRTATVNNLVSHLNYARHTALQQGEEIVVCPSSNSNECANSRSWVNGWITYVNLDRDNPPVRDNNEPVLRVMEPVNGGLTVTANRDSFEFRPFGGAGNGSLVVCDRRNPVNGRAIILSVTGRIRLSGTMADGSALNCAAS